MRALSYRAAWFLYGASINFLLFRWYVSFAYPLGSSNRSVVNHPLTNVCAVVLPGLTVSWLMMRLRARLKKVPANRRGIVIRGGLYGILATVLALEIFYFACAGYAAVRFGAWQPVSATLWNSLAFLVDIQTFGMEPIIRCVPFAFAYGALAGAFTLKIVRREDAAAAL